MRDRRLLQRERKRLLDLPANELIEVVATCGNLIEADQRHSRSQIRDDERRAAWAMPRPFACGAQCLIERRAIDDVVPGQRVDKRARWKLRGAIGLYDGLLPAGTQDGD